MTDKEIENKHYLSQIELGKWYSNAQYYYRPRNDKERNLIHNCYEEGYNKGFSNGLAEGKPKWHDLRKDPNDLPKSKGEYWTKYNGTSEEREGFYDVHYFEPGKPFYEKYWSEIGVIMWIELPKYEE